MPSDPTTPADARETDEEDVKAAKDYAIKWASDGPEWLKTYMRDAFSAGIAHERGKSRPAAASEGLGDAEVAEIQTRCNAATKEPWEYDAERERIYGGDNGMTQVCAFLLSSDQYPYLADELAATRRFILSSRTDVPKLLSALASSRQARRAAEAEATRLREALEAITSTAVEVRDQNTPEFMEYLTERIEAAKVVWRETGAAARAALAADQTEGTQR